MSSDKVWHDAGAYWEITYPAEWGGEFCFVCEKIGKPSLRFQHLMGCRMCDRTWHKAEPLRDIDQRELE